MAGLKSPNKSNACFRLTVLLSGICLSQTGYCWLGDRSNVSTEYSRKEVVNSIEKLTDSNALQQNWIVPEELLEQQNKYRANKELKWPDSKPSVRPAGFTYFPENFSASVSVEFDDKTIEVIIPRQPDLKKKYGYDLVAERNSASIYLKELLGMQKSDLYKRLSAELLIDPQQMKAGSESDDVFLMAVFKNKNPRPDEIERMALQIMKTARIAVQDQEASEDARARTNRVAFVMNIPDYQLMYAALGYKDLVKRFSEEFDVPASLIMAVIHSESFFNPLAQASRPAAYGLMQIVPETAGKDVAQVIYDMPPELSPDFLFNEVNNIRFGAAYLNILYYRYFSQIANEKSRAYLTIAAYSTGPESVARTFASAPRLIEAIPVINTMSDREVLDRLLNFAPEQEVRTYLPKVIERERYYQKFY